jgi:DNA-binding transcriptional LysR family regulator
MMTNLAAVDLNLLVVLQAVHEEGSVSAAARRLGLSQSAASHALARLRDLAGDELFVRVGNRMIATPRADALAGRVTAALREIGAALGDGEVFDPARSVGTVRIAAVDLAQTLLLPELALRVLAQAPGLQIVVGPTPEDPARALADGSVDLVVGGIGAEVGVHRQVLGVDPFVCVVRCDHPCLSEGLTVDRYAALPHALVTPRAVARGHVDDALARVGRTRRAAYVTPQLWSAALVVSRSDLVLTTASRMARLAARNLPLALVEPPLPIEPYALAAAWHPRCEAHGPQAWVRTQLAEIARALLAQPMHEIDLHP